MPVIDQHRSSLKQNYAMIETVNPPGVAVRTKTHMYFVPFSKKTGELEDEPDQFYDLAKDPYELINLNGSKSHKNIFKRLDRYIRKWDISTPWMSGNKILGNDRYLDL
jgi:hypothetical protein